MTHDRDLAHWDEFRDHLEKIPEVESYNLSEDSGTARVYLEDSLAELSVGRELFTRVATMGFIVGEVNGRGNEIKFIDILGKHRGYLPAEVELSTD
jgi:hypothetical protein